MLKRTTNLKESSQSEERKPVLLVDDAADMLDLVGNFLEANGYSVAKALNGLKAMEIIRSGTEFSAVVLDIRMPGEHGMETLVRIKEERPNLPVVMLTGIEDRDVINRAKELGVFDYIVKPPKLDRLETLIAAASTL